MMLRRCLPISACVAAASLLAACAAPSASPQAVRRLPPAELAAIEAAAGRRAPLSLEEIVRRSREGVAAAALIDEIRRTGTRHALAPADVQRLRGQGVAQAVVDELAEGEARRARDQATADKVRRDTAQAEAEDRARAEAERRQRAMYPYGSPYYDPLWPYGYPPGYPGRFGWGLHLRR